MNIEYKQAIYVKNKFDRWHYWGFMPDLTFIGPDMTNGIAHALANSMPYVCDDKNGDKVFAGDKCKIIRCLNCNASIEVIEFGYYSTPFRDTHIKGFGWHFGDEPLSGLHSIEIIGNIHQEAK